MHLCMIRRKISLKINQEVFVSKDEKIEFLYRLVKNLLYRKARHDEQKCVVES